MQVLQCRFAVLLLLPMIITNTSFTMEQKRHQYKVLKKHRDRGLIPSLQKVALGSGVSVSTAALFMNGNSQNPNVIKFIRRHVKKESVAVPADLNKLFTLWDKL